MSIFRWTAPLFKLAARRWSQNDFQVMAAWLRPYVAPDGVFADLGGGTGDLGTGVARTLDARVIIVDPTPQMLRRVDAHPLVSVQLAPAEKLPFPAGYFDAVLCCDAFHHLPDQDTAAKEIARVLRPGGGLLILDAEPTGRNRHWAVLERMLGEPAGFRTMASMEKFLGGYGIVGTCTSQRRGYAFVGSVGTASATET
jgi:ubiquinone/menaquinone biosynthesis C-methylase UbiE